MLCTATRVTASVGTVVSFCFLVPWLMHKVEESSAPSSSLVSSLFVKPESDCCCVHWLCPEIEVGWIMKHTPVHPPWLRGERRVCLSLGTCRPPQMDSDGRLLFSFELRERTSDTATTLSASCQHFFCKQGSVRVLCSPCDKLFV